jgi:hypothetical protein
MKTKNSNQQINAYVVYFLRDGKKRQRLVNSRSEAVNMRRGLLRREHRKFLGFRPVTLQEV